jgi:hypothetical protein
MAKDDWIEIYGTYTAEELATEMADLKKSLKGSYAAQGHGNTSHQRDLGELRDRLAAAARIANRKSEGGAMRVGQVDFSGNGW